VSWALMHPYVDFTRQLGSLLYDPLYRTESSAGHGDQVLLIPGFFSGDWSLQVMAGWLARQGYAVQHSGITWNVHCPLRTGEILRQRLVRLAERGGGPVTVIGHSLGGVLARFLGANSPQYVRRVIALGSPVVGTARIHPLVPFTFRVLQKMQHAAGGEKTPCAENIRCSCAFTQTALAPLPREVEFAAIFSRQDEIIDWRACIDPDGDSYEVSGFHLGLVVNREVYRALTEILKIPRPPFVSPKTKCFRKTEGHPFSHERAAA
jgi:pimeloyl-ACP methyl ester carboxylesterase